MKFYVILVWLTFSALRCLIADGLTTRTATGTTSDAFDPTNMSPIKLLDTLQKEGSGEFLFVKPVKGWVTKKDVPALLSQINSKVQCASVALTASSYYSNRSSTVGNEAIFMLEGFRKGEYPPALNSITFGVDKKELIEWVQSQLGEKRRTGTF
jgi:hypothetical protein